MYGAQLLGTSYEKVEISYNGEIAEKDTRPVTVAALKECCKAQWAPA
jgi:D-3-phosphoglycerate dehydrogenase